MIQPKPKTRVPKTYVGLGFDAGGSSSPWLLCSSGGERLAEGTSGPLTGHIFHAQGGAEQLARFRAILEAAKAVCAPAALVAGITGLTSRYARRAVAGPGRRRYARACAAARHAGQRHARRLRLRVCACDGVLVYAGTGSDAYHESAAGETVRAGGYGYLIDDAGGYWIGHRALQKLFRDLDAGRLADTPLA